MASQGVLQGSSLFAETQSDRVQEQQQGHVAAHVWVTTRGSSRC